MYEVLLVAHTLLVLFLIVMVLLQRTDSDGLSGLSGGGGGNQFLTGRAKGNIMTRTTAYLAGAFMLTSLVLAIMASQMSRSSIVDIVPENAVATEAQQPEKPIDPVVPKPE